MGVIKLGERNIYEYPKSIKEVDEMSGEEFEMFIYKYLIDYCDYDGIKTEKNDYGIDIVAWKKSEENNRFGIQCKRFGPKTVLGENELVKMQKGIKHYNIGKKSNDKANLILFTSAEKKQISSRGYDYIINEQIESYFREDIVEIIKHLDDELGKTKNESNYINVAFDSMKKNPGSFKKNTRFVEILRAERLNIAKYNKLGPAYNVFNDKTMEEIITIKPTTVEELSKVKGFNEDKINMFGEYLINKIRLFMGMDSLTDIKPSKDHEDIISFLKEERKKIAKYNNIDPIYLVFNNRTLEEIAEKKPDTLDKLKLISGMGDTKIELFGEYLITKIKKFVA